MGTGRKARGNSLCRGNEGESVVGDSTPIIDLQNEKLKEEGLDEELDVWRHVLVKPWRGTDEGRGKVGDALRGVAGVNKKPFYY